MYMSMKVTQKTIKSMINSGHAIDVTNWSDSELYRLLENSERIEKPYYSHGINGCNGAVISCDGQLYAVASRCSNMFILL